MRKKKKNQFTSISWSWFHDHACFFRSSIFSFLHFASFQLFRFSAPRDFSALAVRVLMLFGSGCGFHLKKLTSKRHTERTTSNSQFECWQRHNAHVSRVWVCAIVYIVSFCFTVMKFVQWKNEIIVFSSCFFPSFLPLWSVVCAAASSPFCVYSMVRILLIYFIGFLEESPITKQVIRDATTHQIGFATKCAIGFILRFYWMVRQIALKRFYIMRHRCDE